MQSWISGSLRHVLEIHQASEGDELRVGLLNGNVGKGVITHLSSEKMHLEVELDTPPPPALPLTVLLALPPAPKCSNGRFST